MIGAAALALVVAIALMLVRALSGPTLYDRVLAVNSLGTKIILLLGVIGFLTGRPDFLDISILFSLIIIPKNLNRKEKISTKPLKIISREITNGK